MQSTEQAKQILETALRQIRELNVGVYATVNDLTITLTWPKGKYVPEDFTAESNYVDAGDIRSNVVPGPLADYLRTMSTFNASRLANPELIEKLQRAGAQAFRDVQEKKLADETARVVIERVLKGDKPTDAQKQNLQD